MAPALTVKQAVLDALHAEDYRPMYLLEALSNRYSDSEIKQAVSELLREGAIELTHDRVLRAVKVNAA